jgi:hypothetical protein
LLTSTEEAEDAMQEVLVNFGKNNILNEYKSIEALAMTLLKLLSGSTQVKRALNLAYHTQQL